MTPRELFEGWFAEVWNKHDPGRMGAFMADDALFHSATVDGQPVRGPDGFRPLMEAMLGAIPDIEFTIDHIVEQGEMAVARWTATGTHLGHHLGAPATEEQLRVTGMVMIRCADGKVVECWDQWDKLGLLTKIGAMAPTAA